MQKNNIIALIIAVCIAGISGFAGYSVAAPAVSKDCTIEIAGQEISCNKALKQLQDLSDMLENKKMMVERQMRGTICLQNDGEFLPEEDACELEDQLWKWNGETFEITIVKTL